MNMNWFLFFVLSFLTLSTAQSGHFLHITDIHFDPEYAVGAPTMCQIPDMRCCRTTSIPKPLNSSVKASKWGEYTCDSPFLLIDQTMKWITTNLKDIDFVVWTG